MFVFFAIFLHIHNNCLLPPMLIQRALTDNYALVFYIYRYILLWVWVLDFGFCIRACFWFLGCSSLKSPNFKLPSIVCNLCVLRFAFYLQLSLVLFLFRKLQLYLKILLWFSVFGFWRLLCLQE